MLCDHCKECDVNKSEGQEPYSGPHWICPSCHSTYPEEKYDPGKPKYQIPWSLPQNIGSQKNLSPNKTTPLTKDITMQYAPDPLAIFAITASLYEEFKKIPQEEKEKLDEEHEGREGVMRCMNEIASKFEDWACLHIDFDSFDTCYVYHMEDNFGVEYLKEVGGFDGMDENPDENLFQSLAQNMGMIENIEVSNRISDLEAKIDDFEAGIEQMKAYKESVEKDEPMWAKLNKEMSLSQEDDPRDLIIPYIQGLKATIKSLLNKQNEAAFLFNDILNCDVFTEDVSTNTEELAIRIQQFMTPNVAAASSKEASSSPDSSSSTEPELKSSSAPCGLCGQHPSRPLSAHDLTERHALGQHF